MPDNRCTYFRMRLSQFEDLALTNRSTKTISSCTMGEERQQGFWFQRHYFKMYQRTLGTWRFCYNVFPFYPPETPTSYTTSPIPQQLGRRSPQPQKERRFFGQKTMIKSATAPASPTEREPRVQLACSKICHMRPALPTRQLPFTDAHFGCAKKYGHCCTSHQ